MSRPKSCCRSKVVASLEPGRAKDQHSFSAMLDGEMVAANAGACLDLMIGATVKRDVLFFTASRRSELHFPMCLPAAAASPARWTMSATIGAEPAKEARSGSTGAKTLYFENSSCSERRAVSGRLVWDGLGPEDRLGGLSMTPGNSSVDVTINGRNAVTATGWLDKAICVNGASGPKLLYSAVYQMSVGPSHAAKRAAPEASSASAEAAAMASPTTKLCAAVPKSAETAKTDWWHSIRQPQLSLTAGEAEPPLYESPHLTATGMEVAAQTAAVGGYTLDATFDPHVIDGKVTICAIVKTPEQCRY
jgi:hypothetical protein